MNIKVPPQQGKLGFVLVKGYNTPAQRYLHVKLAAGCTTLLEVVNLSDATIFSAQDQAQQWLAAVQTNRPQIARDYQIMGFNREGASV
jgi:hypothetical protein